MKIRLLPQSTINRISAGEVIERPASVIKELIENSIDAGANKIEISIEQSGKNLIIIVDNGQGMDKDDLELAILKNTTSKLIDDDDLSNINSFGFRGEALSSIAEISRLSITSKAQDSSKAYNIQITGGRDKKISPTVFNQGTKLEIRDLFFATPARLKFLRSDKTEYLACVSVIKKLALAHPNVSFKLYSDNRKVLDYQAQTLADQNLNFHCRISEIMGKEFAENSISLDYDCDDIILSGSVSLPTYNKASSEDQFLFVNNRPVRDKILISSLKVAYQDYIAINRFPLAVIFLKIPTNSVDVNVHPAKAEVRFHDPSLVRKAIITATKLSIAKVGNQVSNTHANNFLNNLNKKNDISKYNFMQATNNNNNFVQENIINKDRFNQSNFASNSSIIPKSHEQAFKPFISSSNDSIFKSLPVSPLYKSDVIEDKKEYTTYPPGAAKAQFHKTYIFSQSEDSIIITDQHAAHERLGYEQIKSTLATSGLITQRLLFPEIVELSEELTDYMAKYQTELQKLGLVYEVFGTTGISVTEVPGIIGEANVKQLICDIADHLKDCGEDLALTKLVEHILETYACHYAIRAGRTLSVEEMNLLLRQMEETPFSGQCNHGRPTYIKLDLKSIEKLFGRR